jgi:N-acetylglutamate synthase-like GNAT family acetyltransferase
MKLRLARENDIPSMLGIIRENILKRTYARREMTEMFSKSLNKPTYIVATEGNKLIGFAGYIHSWFANNVCEVFWVHVKPAFQRKGVGSKLMRSVVKRIRKTRGTFKVNLIILSTSSPRFFRKCGFREIAKIRGDKLVLMGLKLP